MALSRAKTTRKPKSGAKTKAKSAARPEAPTKAEVRRRPATGTRAAPTPKPAARKTPRPPPSERAIAACSQLPGERALTDEERAAMAKVAATAGMFLSAVGTPSEIVLRIADYVDRVRRGETAPPESQDVRLGLGVLWGEQVRAQVGWRWVHLTYEDGFASYALVPDDRAHACFPLNRIPALLRPGASTTDTSVPLFEAIRAGELPSVPPDAYLVLG